MQYELDLDKVHYKELIEMDFIEIDDMVFFKDYLNELDKHIEKIKKEGIPKEEIEAQLNHVHINFVTTCIEKQREIVKELRKIWLSKLKKKFPQKNFHFEVEGDKDFVIYLYAK